MTACAPRPSRRSTTKASSPKRLRKARLNPAPSGESQNSTDRRATVREHEALRSNALVQWNRSRSSVVRLPRKARQRGASSEEARSRWKNASRHLAMERGQLLGDEEAINRRQPSSGVPGNAYRRTQRTPQPLQEPSPPVAARTARRRGRAPRAALAEQLVAPRTSGPAKIMMQLGRIEETSSSPGSRGAGPGSCRSAAAATSAIEV